MDFDEIAEKIFKPAYIDAVKDMMQVTGIKAGYILEIGCGGGHFTFEYMENSNITAALIDIDETIISKARYRAVRRGLRERCEFKVGFSDNIPYEDEKFDAVISRCSMPLWENQEKSIDEILRVLKKDGIAYIGGDLGHIENEKIIRTNLKKYGIRDSSRDRKDSFMLSKNEYEIILKERNVKYQFLEPNHGMWIYMKK